MSLDVNRPAAVWMEGDCIARWSRSTEESSSSDGFCTICSAAAATMGEWSHVPTRRVIDGDVGGESSSVRRRLERPSWLFDAIR